MRDDDNNVGDKLDNKDFVKPFDSWFTGSNLSVNF